jgi:hypothetical protein
VALEAVGFLVHCTIDWMDAQSISQRTGPSLLGCLLSVHEWDPESMGLADPEWSSFFPVSQRGAEVSVCEGCVQAAADRWHCHPSPQAKSVQSRWTWLHAGWGRPRPSEELRRPWRI